MISSPSAASTFRGDSRISLVPLRRASHRSMRTNRRIQERILGLLERS